eukprot:727930-Heterocapsa_arctica.AAC.1
MLCGRCHLGTRARGLASFLPTVDGPGLSAVESLTPASGGGAGPWEPSAAVRGGAEALRR